MRVYSDVAIFLKINSAAVGGAPEIKNITVLHGMPLKQYLAHFFIQHYLNYDEHEYDLTFPLKSHIGALASGHTPICKVNFQSF